MLIFSTTSLLVLILFFLPPGVDESFERFQPAKDRHRRRTNHHGSDWRLVPVPRRAQEA